MGGYFATAILPLDITPKTTPEVIDDRLHQLIDPHTYSPLVGENPSGKYHYWELESWTREADRPIVFAMTPETVSFLLKPAGELGTYRFPDGHPFGCYAVITPDGTWDENSEDNKPQWDAKVSDYLKRYSQHYAVRIHCVS